ncbi:MAG: hypothetical protein KKH22_06580 [Proteobacteria bacterium]|nr:hypothetical protein [Pseudomonadota bacterium]
MSVTENTVRCTAVTHPKVSGKYRAPGSTFDCPAHLVGELLELGAVVLAPAEGPSSAEIEASAKAASKKTDDQSAARLSAIVEAIQKLSPDNPANWTADKKPQVKAIEAIAKFNISAEERDQAVEILNKQAE